MKDLRKKQFPLHQNCIKFIKLCEKDNVKVTVTKDFQTKTLLKLEFEDGLIIKKFDYDHAVVNPKKYYNGFFKQHIELLKKVEEQQMENTIKELNKKLYDNNYNSNMITTKEAFIKYYQDFIDEQKSIDGKCSLETHLLKFINQAKNSEHTHVIDSIMNDEQIDLFSTIEELNKLIKEFEIE